MLREVTVAVPPFITEPDIRLGSDVVTAAEDAVREVVSLDHGRGAELEHDIVEGLP